MTLVGQTALSVETRTSREAPAARAVSATLMVPSTLVSTASVEFSSMSGTCFSAAA